MGSKKTEKSSAELYREERKKRMAREAKKHARRNPRIQRAGKAAGRAVSVILAAAIALGAVFGVLNFFGVPQMTLTAAKFGSLKANAAKYNFYYTELYQNIAQQSQQYEAYGKGMGVQLTGFDYTKTPTEQEYAGEDLKIKLKEGKKPTWADFLRVKTLENMRQYIVYAELARQTELTLTEEETADIDKQMEDYRSKAKDNDFALSRFLQMIYGKGVTERLFRSVMEERALAYKYVQKTQENIRNGITDEEIKTEYDKNIKDYALASCAGFKIAAKPEKQADDATDEQKAEAKKNAMEKAKTEAQTCLAAVTDEASLVEQAKAYDKKLTEDKIVQKNASYASVSGSLGEKAADWLFSDVLVSETRPAKTVIEDKDGYTVILVLEPPHRDERRPVSVRHILIKFPEDENGRPKEPTEEERLACYDKADELYKKLLSYGEKPTEDKFAELAKANSEDPGSKENGGLYEGVKLGQMAHEFEDWCFAAGRKAGDTGIVKTVYGYHIMYFVKADGEQFWEETIKNKLTSEKTEAAEKTLFAEDGSYAIAANKTVVKWASGQQEEQIKKQHVRH